MVQIIVIMKKKNNIPMQKSMTGELNEPNIVGLLSPELPHGAEL
jgi:hypothetical protein